MCEYCNFEYPEHEYLGSKNLELSVDGGKKEYFEAFIEEDPDFDHFIVIDGSFTTIRIPIEFCPKCSRKL